MSCPWEIVDRGAAAAAGSHAYDRHRTHLLTRAPALSSRVIDRLAQQVGREVEESCLYRLEQVAAGWRELRRAIAERSPPAAEFEAREARRFDFDTVPPMASRRASAERGGA